MQDQGTGSSGTDAAKTVRIVLQPVQRAILRDALLDDLSLQSERLDHALMRADRAQRPKVGRKVARRICRVAALLDLVGWGDPHATGELKIDVHSQAPLAARALRKVLVCAEDNATDARAYGDSEDALKMATRLQNTWETLIEIEAQAIRARKVE